MGTVLAAVTSVFPWRGPWDSFRRGSLRKSVSLLWGSSLELNQSQAEKEEGMRLEKQTQENKQKEGKAGNTHSEPRMNTPSPLPQAQPPA